MKRAAARGFLVATLWLQAGAFAQNAPTPVTPSTTAPTPSKDASEEKRGEIDNIVRSRVDREVFYYIEDPKTSKAQRKAWEKKCRRKHPSDFPSQKKCFDRLKQNYLDNLDD